MITAFEEWIPKTDEVTLPSGRVALLQKPDLVNVVTSGEEIPDVLTNMVMASINGQEVEPLNMSMTPENMPSIMKLLNVIAAACFVEPKVTNIEPPPPQMVLAKWIPFRDRAHVLGWALGAQFQPAAIFPAQQTGDVGTVPAGASLPGKAKPDIRHKG